MPTITDSPPPSPAPDVPLRRAKPLPRVPIKDSSNLDETTAPLDVADVVVTPPPTEQQQQRPSSSASLDDVASAAAAAAAEDWLGTLPNLTPDQFAALAAASSGAQHHHLSSGNDNGRPDSFAFSAAPSSVAGSLAGASSSVLVMRRPNTFPTMLSPTGQPATAAGSPLSAVILAEAGPAPSEKSVTSPPRRPLQSSSSRTSRAPAAGSTRAASAVSTHDAQVAAATADTRRRRPSKSPAPTASRRPASTVVSGGAASTTSSSHRPPTSPATPSHMRRPGSSVFSSSSTAPPPPQSPSSFANMPVVPAYAGAARRPGGSVHHSTRRVAEAYEPDAPRLGAVADADLARLYVRHSTAFGSSSVGGFSGGLQGPGSVVSDLLMDSVSVAGRPAGHGGITHGAGGRGDEATGTRAGNSGGALMTTGVAPSAGPGVTSMPLFPMTLAPSLASGAHLGAHVCQWELGVCCHEWEDPSPTVRRHPRLCGSRFSSGDALYKHMVAHHVMLGSGPRRCGHCHWRGCIKVFRNDSKYLRRDHFKHHITELVEYVCLDCGRVCEKEYGTGRHICREHAAAAVTARARTALEDSEEGSELESHGRRLSAMSDAAGGTGGALRIGVRRTSAGIAAANSAAAAAAARTSAPSSLAAPASPRAVDSSTSPIPEAGHLGVSTDATHPTSPMSPYPPPGGPLPSISEADMSLSLGTASGMRLSRVATTIEEWVRNDAMSSIRVPGTPGSQSTSVGGGTSSRPVSRSRSRGANRRDRSPSPDRGSNRHADNDDAQAVGPEVGVPPVITSTSTSAAAMASARLSISLAALPTGISPAEFLAHHVDPALVRELERMVRTTRDEDLGKDDEKTTTREGEATTTTTADATTDTPTQPPRLITSVPIETLVIDPVVTSEWGVQTQPAVDSGIDGTDASEASSPPPPNADLAHFAELAAMILEQMQHMQHSHDSQSTAIQALLDAQATLRGVPETLVDVVAGLSAVARAHGGVAEKLRSVEDVVSEAMSRRGSDLDSLSPGRTRGPTTASLGSKPSLDSFRFAIPDGALDSDLDDDSDDDKEDGDDEQSARSTPRRPSASSSVTSRHTALLGSSSPRLRHRRSSGLTRCDPLFAPRPASPPAKILAATAAATAVAHAESHFTHYAAPPAPPALARKRSSASISSVRSSSSSIRRRQHEMSATMALSLAAQQQLAAQLSGMHTELAARLEMLEARPGCKATTAAPVLVPDTASLAAAVVPSVSEIVAAQMREFEVKMSAMLAGALSTITAAATAAAAAAPPTPQSTVVSRDASFGPSLPPSAEAGVMTLLTRKPSMYSVGCGQTPPASPRLQPVSVGDDDRVPGSLSTSSSLVADLIRRASGTSLRMVDMLSGAVPPAKPTTELLTDAPVIAPAAAPTVTATATHAPVDPKDLPPVSNYAHDDLLAFFAPAHRRAIDRYEPKRVVVPVTLMHADDTASDVGSEIFSSLSRRPASTLAANGSRREVVLPRLSTVSSMASNGGGMSALPLSPPSPPPRAVIADSVGSPVRATRTFTSASPPSTDRGLPAVVSRPTTPESAAPQPPSSSPPSVMAALRRSLSLISAPPSRQPSPPPVPSSPAGSLATRRHQRSGTLTPPAPIATPKARILAFSPILQVDIPRASTSAGAAAPWPPAMAAATTQLTPPAPTASAASMARTTSTTATATTATSTAATGAQTDDVDYYAMPAEAGYLSPQYMAGPSPSSALQQDATRSMLPPTKVVVRDTHTIHNNTTTLVREQQQPPQQVNTAAAAAVVPKKKKAVARFWRMIKRAFRRNPDRSSTAARRTVSGVASREA
ncbi:hypothetical protein BC828DRAFT_403719 [Blastocladiella britannica]|nr:hypothetical protein BC828DRAFT_403719 [Blastocladiella britannica]